MDSCLHNTFGIAARNFTAYPEMPDAQALVDYGVQDGGDGLRLALGLGPHPARRRAELSDHRFAHAADGDRRAHDEDQACDRHPGAAAAQSGGAREAAVEHGSALRTAAC